MDFLNGSSLSKGAHRNPGGIPDAGGKTIFRGIPESWGQSKSWGHTDCQGHTDFKASSDIAELIEECCPTLIELI